MLNDTPELRAKIVQKLVHKVEVLPNVIRVHFFVGKSAVVQMNGDLESQKQQSPGVLAPGFGELSNRGSNRLTNGWLDWD